MAIVLPDPRFEMPELFIPGRKPTGKVVLNRSAPLAPDMFAVIPGLQNSADLVSGVLPQYVGSAYKSHNGIETPDTGYDDRVQYSVPLSLPDDTFTLVTKFKNTASNLNFLTRMWDFVGTGDNEFKASSTASTFYLRYRGTGFVDYSFGADFWNDGQEHTIVLRVFPRAAGYYDADLYCDGTFFQSTWRTIDAYPDITDIYLRSHATDANSSPVGYTEYFYMYGRTLSVEQINSVLRDPYQFLVPA